MLTLGDILEALVGMRPAWATQVVREAVIDSRQATPGALFVALSGEQVDGHDYVMHAFQNGASFALVQRKPSPELVGLDLRDKSVARQFLASAEPPAPAGEPICLWVENCLQSLQDIARYWRRQINVRVIGITGSVGKSTTKELVSEVLSQRYQTLKNPGNYNNEIGLPLTLLSLTENHERAVLEMGFYMPGEIKFLCDLAQPEIGVVTNIGTVHAERAGSIEAIAQGKAELVQSLPADGVAVLNYDDPWVKEMAGQTQAKVFFYGLDPDADLWADNVEGLGLEGIRFQLHYKDEDIYLRVPLIGRHSVHTALRAAAVGLVDGLTWQEIVRGLRSGKSQLRLVVVRSESGALLLDDTYNASPQSTLAALNLLEELDGHKIAVLGDMLELGPYEEEGHELVGRRAAVVADELACLGMRSLRIAAAALEAGMPETAITQWDEPEDLTNYLRSRLSAQDVVLIKGSRGMRMDRIVAALEARR